MTAPMSTHLPEVSGGIATVTGSLVIETGLRKIKTIVATLGAAPIATDATVAVTLIEPPAGGKYKATLQVVNADGVTPGVTATPVHWLALGD